jgi:histidine phosphotransferase ChpT
MTTLTIDPLDLAALLCSRVCHDVIGPVGAIINGLEVLEDEKEEDMRGVALDLIRKSANSASARLQFCRLAFGAAGSMGASIDSGDAEAVVRGLIGSDRTTLAWNAHRQFAPKNIVKLLLNLCLVASSAIPRGGVVTVDFTVKGSQADISVGAKGLNARLAHGVGDILSGQRQADSIDAHSIQPYYTTLLARECGLALEATVGPEGLTLRAAPHVKPSAESAPAAPSPQA